MPSYFDGYEENPDLYNSTEWMQPTQASNAVTDQRYPAMAATPIQYPAVAPAQSPQTATVPPTAAQQTAPVRYSTNPNAGVPYPRTTNNLQPRDWAQIINNLNTSGEVWHYDDYGNYFYNPQTQATRVLPREGYNDTATHEQMLTRTSFPSADPEAMYKSLLANPEYQALASQNRSDYLTGKIGSYGRFG